jgi:hypothetical protein
MQRKSKSPCAKVVSPKACMIKGVKSVKAKTVGITAKNVAVKNTTVKNTAVKINATKKPAKVAAKAKPTTRTVKRKK